MTAIFEVLGFVLPLSAMLVAGIALWALGQWLRRKGHGDLLDRIEVCFGKFQRVTGRVSSPLVGSMIGLLQGLSRLPMLGSKRSRAMLERIEQKTPQNQDK